MLSESGRGSLGFTRARVTHDDTGGAPRNEPWRQPLEPRERAAARVEEMRVVERALLAGIEKRELLAVENHASQFVCGHCLHVLPRFRFSTGAIQPSATSPSHLCGFHPHRFQTSNSKRSVDAAAEALLHSVQRINSISTSRSRVAHARSAVTTLACSRIARAMHARSPSDKPFCRVAVRKRPAATASAVSNGRISRPKARSEARASSPLAPKSTSRATTSEALTAEMIPLLRCRPATSAPCSSNAIASSAELSKTALTLLPTWLACPPGTDRRYSRPASCTSACGPGSVEPQSPEKQDEALLLLRGPSPGHRLPGRSLRASREGSGLDRQRRPSVTAARGHEMLPAIRARGPCVVRRSASSSTDTECRPCSGCRSRPRNARLPRGVPHDDLSHG